MRDLPYVRFYPSEWLADAGVQELSPMAELIYFRLCCVCWQEGGLEFYDPEGVDGAPVGRERGVWPASWGRIRGGIRALVGRRLGARGARVWLQCGARVASHFVLQSDGKWWNKRMLREYRQASKLPPSDERRGEQMRGDKNTSEAPRSVSASHIHTDVGRPEPVQVRARVPIPGQPRPGMPGGGPLFERDVAGELEIVRRKPGEPPVAPWASAKEAWTTPNGSERPQG